MSEVDDAARNLCTERVTLEVTYNQKTQGHPSTWDWSTMVLEEDESVRVVEEFGKALPKVVEDMATEIKRLDAELKAACHAQAELRSKRDELQTGCNRLNSQLAKKDAPYERAMRDAIKGMERMQRERDEYKDRVVALEAEVTDLNIALGKQWNNAVATVVAADTAPVHAPTADYWRHQLRRGIIAVERLLHEEPWVTPWAANRRERLRDLVVVYREHLVPLLNRECADSPPSSVHHGSGVFDANGDEVPWEGVVATLTAERDAAIRERDEARQVAQTFEALCLGEQARNKVLQARVAELEAHFNDLSRQRGAFIVRIADLESQLESVACRAATAETALEAASGGAEVEPVAHQELQDRWPRDTEFVIEESAGNGSTERLHRETWLRLERDELIHKRDELISRVAELEAASGGCVIRDIVNIIRSDADSDEKHAAMSTLVEAVCPGWVLTQAGSGGGYVGDGVVLECDDCGKCFWFDDTSGGSHRMIEPDNAFGGEVWESYCPACNTQAASGGWEGEA